MDAKRIKLLEDHLAAGSSSNVRLACQDFCELVTASKTEDAGLVKSAKSMAGHVGFVAISRDAARVMLQACKPSATVARSPSPASQPDEAAKK